MRKFAVPYPTGPGGTALPPIVVTEITATIDTSNSPDYDAAMSSQLARRDLNVVPTFLPGTFFIDVLSYVLRLHLPLTGQLRHGSFCYMCSEIIWYIYWRN